VEPPGTWEVRYSLGKQRVHHRVHGTRQDAQKWLTAALKALDDGDATAPSRITLAAFLDLYLGQKGKSPSWYRLNGDSARHWREAGIGDTRLQALTALNVLQARDRLLGGERVTQSADVDGGLVNSSTEISVSTDSLPGTRRLTFCPPSNRGNGKARRRARKDAVNGRHARSNGGKQQLSAKSVANDLEMLRSALTWGIEMEFLPRNVALKVDMPEVERKPQRTWSLEEADRFLAACWDLDSTISNMHAVGLLTAARTYSQLGGARRGDLDLEAGTLVLDQALVLERDKRGEMVRILKPAGNRKNKRRTLDLPARALPFLDRQLKWLDSHGKPITKDTPTAWNRHNLLFPNPYGEPQAKRTVANVFDRLCRQADLPKTNIHSMRHTTATLLLASGANIRIVQEVLGHSDIRVTMGTYAHLARDVVRESLNGVYREEAETKDAPAQQRRGIR
jgi:integrase